MDMERASGSGDGICLAKPSTRNVLCVLTLCAISFPVIYNLGYGQRSTGAEASSRIVNVRANQLEPLLNALVEEDEEGNQPTTHARVEMPDPILPLNDAGREQSARIVRIQEILSRLKYYDGPFSGRVDPRTRQAIRDFQKAHSLTATGTPDDGVVDALAHMEGMQDEGQFTASISRQVTPSIIRQVQTALTLLGYDAGPIDGALGTQTVHAVRAFQEQKGFQPDGRINNELLHELGITNDAN